MSLYVTPTLEMLDEALVELHSNRFTSNFSCLRLAGNIKQAFPNNGKEALKILNKWLAVYKVYKIIDDLWMKIRPWEHENGWTQIQYYIRQDKYYHADDEEYMKRISSIKETRMQNTILSIKILDDLENAYSDSISIENESYECILDAVKKISEPLTTGRVADPTIYYFRDTNIVWQTQKDYDPEDIANDLFGDGYYVWNRYEKYYVIAYALNFTRFEVYSKDCNKELIKWRVGDKDDPVKGVITNPDYNENPVITFMKNAKQLKE